MKKQKLKTFTVLAVADVHMSNKLPYARPTSNGLTDRFQDQLKLWETIHAAADEHDVNAILDLGDLFDKSLVDPVTLTHTVEAILEGDWPHYILPGNHDANSIRGGRFIVEALGKMRQDHIHVLEAGDKLEAQGWLTFWAIPFTTAGPTRTRLAEIRAEMDKRQVNVLLFHNSVIGARHLGWVCDDGLTPDEVCEGFDWVLSGHFHDQQIFGTTGLYLGAPMHHSFVDVGREAGFWIIKFRSNRKCNHTFTSTDLPTFHLRDDLDADVDEVQPGDYLRYEIKATHADWAKTKPKARERCEKLREAGIKADFKHKPIYHHEARLVESDETEKTAKLSMGAAVSRYVEAADVVKGDLDPKRLKQIGREAIEAVRDSHGLV